MHEQAESASQLAQAEAASTRVKRQGRWYPLWVMLWGFFTVALFTVEGFGYRSIWLGGALAIVLVVIGIAIGRWKSRQPVHPLNKRQRNRNWMYAWIALYAIAHAYVGPIWLDDHIVAWALMGIVVAVPAFLEAARCWRLRKI